MATVTIGNNFSKDIAEIRDDCLAAFDRDYIVDLENKADTPAMADSTMQYFISRRDNRMLDYYKRQPAEKLMAMVARKHMEIEAGSVWNGDKYEPIDEERAEKEVALMLLAIEDAHMGRERVMLDSPDQDSMGMC